MNKDEIAVMVHCAKCGVVVGHAWIPKGTKEPTRFCWECGLAREENGKEVIPLTVVCSYCGKLLKQIDGENVGMVSHGICPDCAKKLKEGYFEENPRRLLKRGYDLDG